MPRSRLGNVLPRPRRSLRTKLVGSALFGTEDVTASFSAEDVRAACFRAEDVRACFRAELVGGLFVAQGVEVLGSRTTRHAVRLLESAS